MSKSIDKLNKLISLQMSEEIKKYSKKEQLNISKEVDKMSKFLNGIRTMRGLPQAIVVTDPIAEHNAVSEAKKLNIPVIAIANTNANPDLIDFLIPANTTSIRAIFLIITILNDAICEAIGEPLKIIGKPDEEIILPEIAKKKPEQAFISHKKFGRSYQSKQAEGTEESKTAEAK
ncbi:MAG: 30S ribosomal protein S2 [Mycoplasmoidaceae bacterium]|nr:30S ribosomal protein S2 [Mycoplasmoidaceae bacterium]